MRILKAMAAFTVNWSSKLSSSLIVVESKYSDPKV